MRTLRKKYQLINPDTWEVEMEVDSKQLSKMLGYKKATSSISSKLSRTEKVNGYYIGEK